MDKKRLEKIVTKIEQKSKFFKKKSLLDTLSYSEQIIGREKQTEELVTYLLGYKQGFVVPLVSIYGRSGSGKSTITRFVCENLEGISHCFVNLRKAKTVFGSVNLILGELGHPSLKSAHGLNVAIEKIEEAIVAKLSKENKNFLVLVLDEFDVFFYDKRGKPSDFVYKLLVLEENLKTKGLMMCIVCISNNVVSNYELDDRVKSRIGSSEIFFEPYSKDDVIEILHQRAMRSLASKLDKSVIEYCAEISTLGHGDARRAIDLLRVAAEIAAQKGEKISKSHIDKASEDLQKDRIMEIISTSSHHFQVVCLSLARMTYLTGQDWHATSSIVKQYYNNIEKDGKHLSYRRIAELLVELENTGLVVSETGSKGRYGYGTRYKLTVLPVLVIRLVVSKKTWDSMVANKKKHDEFVQSYSYKHPGPGSGEEADKIEYDRKWKEYVGL